MFFCIENIHKPHVAQSCEFSSIFGHILEDVLRNFHTFPSLDFAGLLVCDRAHFSV